MRLRARESEGADGVAAKTDASDRASNNINFVMFFMFTAKKSEFPLNIIFSNLTRKFGNCSCGYFRLSRARRRVSRSASVSDAKPSVFILSKIRSTSADKSRGSEMFTLKL